MRKTRSSALRNLISLAVAIAIILNAQQPAAAWGDFSGSDALTTGSAKWSPFSAFCAPGNGKCSFQNSRLEYLVSTPTAGDQWFLRWTSNQGGYDQDWFVQVYVHLAKVPLNKECWINIGLATLNNTNHDQGYCLEITRDRNGTEAIPHRDIEAGSIDDKYDFDSLEQALDATLRIHVDSKTNTLIGSRKTGNTWKYFPPANISYWQMNDRDTFTVVLGGTSGNDPGTRIGPVVQSGDAYFTHFKAGTASSDIEMEQPVGSNLSDGKSKSSFGTAPLNGRKLSKTFTIRNTGNANLTGLAISKGGSHAPDIILTAPLKTTLAPGTSTTFTVDFKPSAAGTRNAAIHIALTGKGVVKAAPPSASLLSRSDHHTRPSIRAVRLADGRKYLTLTVMKSSETAWTTPVVEVSPNLIDWFSGSHHTTVITDNAAFLKVRDNTPLAPGKKRYIRMGTTRH